MAGSGYDVLRRPSVIDVNVTARELPVDKAGGDFSSGSASNAGAFDAATDGRKICESKGDNTSMDRSEREGNGIGEKTP
ncbi:MAG: hypothetical protein A4E19_16405 [Nitrospira sp. SG-bin1]|nr:MAG: hypothetical protein A4E19_16405 [Nitrospira sp. SG-bin1]